MELVNLLAISFAAGLLAQVMTPRFRPLGIVMSALVGIVGTGLATILGQAVGFYREGALAGFLGSALGALAIVALSQFIAPSRPSGKAKHLLGSEWIGSATNIRGAANDETTVVRLKKPRHRG